MQPKKVTKIVVRVEPDPNPDLSYIGDYTSRIPADVPDFRVFDRKELGIMGHNEHRYFVATESAETRRQAENDFREMERIYRGDLWFNGIWVEAEVLVPSDVHGGYTVQTIGSGGLWGIESDADADYLRGIVSDQIYELGGQLRQLGVTKAQMQKAAIISPDIPISDEAAFRSLRKGHRIVSMVQRGVRPRISRRTRRSRGPGPGWWRQPREHAVAARKGWNRRRR